MEELNIKLQVPEEYAEEAERLAKTLISKELLLKALEQCAKLELQKHLLKSIASKSKLTEEKALELGELIKDGVAKKHKL